MIVKMTILMILGSSDDKNRCSQARRVAPTGVPLMVFWCRRESKPSQLIGTG